MKIDYTVSIIPMGIDCEDCRSWGEWGLWQIESLRWRFVRCSDITVTVGVFEHHRRFSSSSVASVVANLSLLLSLPQTRLWLGFWGFSLSYCSVVYLDVLISYSRLSTIWYRDYVLILLFNGDMWLYSLVLLFNGWSCCSMVLVFNGWSCCFYLMLILLFNGDPWLCIHLSCFIVYLMVSICWLIRGFRCFAFVELWTQFHYWLQSWALFGEP